ncbi:MAG: hypothetical protein JWP75_3756, partial [Frondihabitans sp.]|nr:hypothetical protein [Frondihabitans sp.]
MEVYDTLVQVVHAMSESKAITVAPLS